MRSYLEVWHRLRRNALTGSSSRSAETEPVTLGAQFLMARLRRFSAATQLGMTELLMVSAFLLASVESRIKGTARVAAVIPAGAQQPLPDIQIATYKHSI